MSSCCSAGSKAPAGRYISSSPSGTLCAQRQDAPASTAAAQAAQEEAVAKAKELFDAAIAAPEELVNSIASTVKAELEGAQASVDGALSSAKAKAGNAKKDPKADAKLAIQYTKLRILARWLENPRGCSWLVWRRMVAQRASQRPLSRVLRPRPVGALGCQRHTKRRKNPVSKFK